MKVYGDRLLPKLKYAYEELVEKEELFCLDETDELLLFSSDVDLYLNLKSEIKSIIGLLEFDEIRGETAIAVFREKVILGELQDLFYRLVESGKYPKIWELYDYDERVD